MSPGAEHPLLPELLGRSPELDALRGQVERLLRLVAARRGPPILIQGETGSGKSLLARQLHEAGRSGGPFVAVNCAAIPESLLEAELFGFERGAFTDARQSKAGLFQAAHQGTLFLDEVALLPEALQAKLLTAIEDGAVRRLGSTRSEPVAVWIIAASNQDLVEAVRARRFREDLYHRLAVVVLALPPLRALGSDILLLARPLPRPGVPRLRPCVEDPRAGCAGCAPRSRVAGKRPRACQHDGACRALDRLPPHRRGSLESAVIAIPGRAAGGRPRDLGGARGRGGPRPASAASRGPRCHRLERRSRGGEAQHLAEQAPLSPRQVRAPPTGGATGSTAGACHARRVSAADRTR